MKVLMIVEAAGAGTGRHTVDLARGLAERGDVVHVAYSPRRSDAGFLDGIARDPRVQTHVIPMRRGPHSSDLSVLKTLSAVAAEHGPFDIIHGQSSKGGLLARMLPRGRAAVCYTPHCIFTMDPDRPRLARAAAWVVERGLAYRCDRILAVAQAERRHLLRAGFPASRVAYVPNGVEMEFVTPRAEAKRNFGIDPEHVVVGAIGRLARQKNPQLLLRAFALLAADHPRCTLLMVGDGELKDDCLRLADELGLAGRVVWAGYRSALESLPAFDILAMPSRYEAFPYVLLEALAAGLPIVATPVGGTTETVRPGENGTVVADFTPAAFAAALWPLVDDADLRERQGSASRELAKSFSVRNMVDAIRDLYCQLKPPALRMPKREAEGLR